MEEFVAKICPYCNTDIREGDAVKVCPVCGAAHHEVCWTLNKGCAVPGCGWHESDPVAEPAETPEPEPIAEPAEIPEPEPVAESEENPEPEPIAEPAEIQEPEPVVEPAEVQEPEPVVEPEEPVAPALFCANCGTPLDDGHDFCPKCGTPKTLPQKRLCPNCGAELGDGHDFCPKCGTRYDPDRGPAPAAPSVPVTAPVTVEPKKSKKKLLIPIIAVVSALALGLILFFVLQGTPVTSLMLDNYSLDLDEGTSAKLLCTISPDNASDKTLTWTSSDEAVATVDNNGLVTAVGAGNCKITVSSSNEKTEECKVTVRTPVSAVSFNKDTLELVEGKTATLICTVSPDNATDKSLTWKSSNESVATVDKNGLVTAIAPGNCTITVTSNNGKTDECRVTVEKAGPDLKALYSQYCKSTWADVGSDGSYLSVDTNPYNKDDSGLAYPEAYYAIKNINAALGLPESLIEDMGQTTWSMGKQSETFNSVGITVSWTYHPDKGLEVTYKLIND